MSKMEEFTAVFDKGPVIDLHRAKVAIGLYECISEHADAINDSQYGELFFYIQSFSSKVMALRTCNLYATSKKAYPQYSFDYLLGFIVEHAEELEPAYFGKIDELIPNRTDLSTAEYNRAFAKILESQLPLLMKEKAADDRDVSIAYEKARLYRDKWAAHHEIVDKIEGATLDGFKILMGLAEDLIDMIGTTYTGSPYKLADGEYELDLPPENWPTSNVSSMGC